MRDAFLSPALGVAASLVAMLAVGWAHFAIGLELGYSALTFLPVLLAAWYFGWRWAVVIALANTATWGLVDPLAGHGHAGTFITSWKYLNHALVYLALAAAVAGYRRRAERERALKAMLSKALEEVGELKGLLPVCAWCHKVRDDQGYWGELETFIEARTGNTGELPILPRL